MSKIALTPNASGSGTFTIASPNSNTDRSLTLPDGAGTIDRLERAGNVLQVLSSTRNSAYSTTSTSYVSPDGLSVAITPSSTSSKILIVFEGKGGSATGHALRLRLERDGTGINLASGQTFGQEVNIPVSPDQNRHYHSASMMYLDSPSTTSSITYRLALASSGGQVTLNTRQLIPSTSIGTSTITVMEIAG
jgi:hypothetical protein